MTVDPASLYATAWEALIAAAKAAKAGVCGTNSVHPSNRRMDGRRGCGIWVTDDQVVAPPPDGSSSRQERH